MVPEFFRTLRDGRLVHPLSGVVNEDVQLTAEAIEGVCHCGIHIIELADIGPDDVDLAGAGCGFVLKLPGAFGVGEIRAHNGSPTGRKGGGNRIADAAAGPGDEGDFACECLFVHSGQTEELRSATD